MRKNCITKLLMFSNRDFLVGWTVMESGPRGTIMKEWMKPKNALLKDGVGHHAEEKGQKHEQPTGTPNLVHAMVN